MKKCIGIKLMKRTCTSFVPLVVLLHMALLMIPALTAHAFFIRGHVRQFIHVQKFNPYSPQTPVVKIEQKCSKIVIYCDFHNFTPLAPHGYFPACLRALGRSFFVCCLAHRGSTVGFLLLQCSSGVVRHPRDLQVSVATRFCRVLIFASS